MTDATAAATHEDGLRAWARGIHTTEAATELLIRTGWARPGLPWVKPYDETGHDTADEPWSWIDFQAIPDHTGAYSGGERRLLRLAASIGAEDDVVVSVGECIAGLDRDHVDLVLAALAHAAGTHEGRPVVVDEQAGTATFGDPYASLHPWPEKTR